jgi:protein SCO1/2
MSHSSGSSDAHRRRRVFFALALVCLGVLTISAEVAVGIGLHLGPWRAQTSKLLGDETWAAGSRPAPGFRLFDQSGRTVTLRALRGHPVVLTFLYSHCRELCPTIGAELTQLQRSLPEAGQPELVIVSVDPGGDTPQSVRAFAANEGWNGDWRWLLGTKADLAPVWRRYGIEVKPGGGQVGHSGVVYLIDSKGNERSGYVAPFLVQDIASDLRDLNGAGFDRTRIELVAAVVAAVAALAILALLAPWAARARGQLRGLGAHRRMLAASLALVSILAAGALLLRPAASAPRVAGALIPAPARRPALSIAGGSLLSPPRFSLAAARGRIVYVNFFASWCLPCRQEAVDLEAFANGLDPRRARFVGVDVSDKPADALGFIHRYGLTYPVIADSGGKISHRYQLLGLPTTVVIDQRGRVAVQLLGPQTTAELNGTLSRLAPRVP